MTCRVGIDLCIGYSVIGTHCRMWERGGPYSCPCELTKNALPGRRSELGGETAHPVARPAIKELTEEFNTTTVVNTHDMNSLTEIGEKIVFIYKGKKWWEGAYEEIRHSDNKELNDFVFASKIMQRMRD